MTTQTIDDISGRARVMPQLVAVRFEGQSVSYGDLDASITAYTEVLHRHGMGSEASLPAGIMNRFPTVAERSLVDVAKSVTALVGWLGRASRGISAARQRDLA